MIISKNGQFYDGAKPVLLISGEIHYFRLPKDLWDIHLDRLLEAGCNTLSTYVPWLIHEETEGDFDFTGRFNPSYDLVCFLGLAAKKGLYVFLRPGPYVMAEMKNEGLPFWLFAKEPSLRVRTWNNEQGPSAVVDMMHPVFLHAVKSYYKAFSDAVRPFLQTNGGPVFAIQLDNEIGMLDWVNNKPALTDDVIIKLGDTVDQSTRLPAKGKSLQFHDRLGTVMRSRFKDYANTLKSFMTDMGVSMVLWMINIHGTSHGRAKTFPIGISQLLSVTDEDHFIGGMDVYYDDITLATFQDVIIANALTKATVTLGKPLTALEFGVGDGNYGDDLMGHQMESSNDFRLRMHIAGGHKMINNYLFSGGINPRLRIPANDGNDRIAFTGERHGFAAPIDHFGNPRYTFDVIKKTQTILKSLSSIISTMDTMADDVVLGFVPDDYLTEYVCPHDTAIKDLVDHTSMHRNSVLWDRVLKGVLLENVLFSAVRMDRDQALSQIANKCLIMPMSRYMDSNIQNTLKSHLENNGKAIFVGELPRYDRLGRPCDILASALKAKPLEPSYGWTSENLSAYALTPIQGAHEFRTFLSAPMETAHPPIIRTLDGKTLAFTSENAIVIGSDYPGDLAVTRGFLNHFGISQRLELRNKSGYVISMLTGREDQMMIHLFNLEQRPVSFDLYIDGLPYQKESPIILGPRDARMLPRNIPFSLMTVICSSAEIISADDCSVTFRRSLGEDHVLIRTTLEPQVTAGITVQAIEPGQYAFKMGRNFDFETFSITFKAGR